MRDVAARAGVSTKTVSRVFNDDPHVLPETRALVEQAMRELNYVPNVLATTFRAGRTSVIGVAVPDIVDPFFASIARAIEDTARERGLSTLVTSLGEDPDDERAAIESMLGRQLSGLVVAPVGVDHSWLQRWREHTPIVFVDRAPVGLETDTFTEADEAGAVEAVRHLLSHGHRRIAYIGDVVHLSTETNRLEGWRGAQREAGIEPDEDLVQVFVSDRDAAREAVARLRALPDPPTAIFSANARCSMALASVVRDEPIALVGFGDFPMADILTPSVTVIDQNPRRLGTLAAERIFARLAGTSLDGPVATVMDVGLVERESCRL
ncbi:substrate-binding domain-containing protein [Microbacterium sp. MEC084]|uniref:LacI family DNA-binding transcriptional regulator n=1 Tax=Microbacterium sp. MEC084 TaxID=1963027 RepID=UPI0010705AC1|nr:LacI family DNA-binding transcriptional regulator [Microbacterium sp. MEC084]MCD1269927.1 substrate-binding domain-containing protein [Microbacterium sp. MEC084]